MSADGDEHGKDPTARIALGAIGIVVLIVIGTLAVDSLKAPDPSPDSDTGQSDAPPASGAVTSGTTSNPAATEDLLTSAGGVELGIDAWRKLLLKDPRAAAVSVAQMAADDDRDARLTELMVHWTAKSPGAAGAWLLEQAVGDFRTESSAEFTRAWADRDPAAAAKWLSPNIDNPAAVDAIGGLLSRWTHTDANAAREWTESLTSPAARETACSALAYTWVQTDPRAAAMWVADLKESDLRATAARNLVNAWSTTDPRAAADWLSANLSDPGERDAAALPLILSWANSDPRTASQWVAGLPSGQLQEQSKAIFAEALAVEAPEDAVVWARSIGDAEQRNESILNIYEDWMEADKPALLSHLRTSVSTNTDATLRDEIYNMLFDNDPAFREELIQLYEQGAP